MTHKLGKARKAYSQWTILKVVVGDQGKQKGWCSALGQAKEGSCRHCQGSRGGSDEGNQKEKTIWRGPPERVGISGTGKQPARGPMTKRKLVISTLPPFPPPSDLFPLSKQLAARGQGRPQCSLRGQLSGQRARS